MADGTRLVSTYQHALQLLTTAGWVTNITGDEDEEGGFVDGKGSAARFYYPCGMTVDAAGHIVVADSVNIFFVSARTNKRHHHLALRRVSKAGEATAGVPAWEELHRARGRAQREVGWWRTVMAGAGEAARAGEGWEQEQEQGQGQGQGGGGQRGGRGGWTRSDGRRDLSTRFQHVPRKSCSPKVS
jgi:hypothetical protein